MKKQKVENKEMKKQKEENEDDDYKNEYENENEVDDETTSQNKKKNKIIKDLNANLDKVIDKSKLFEEQTELFKKLEGLKGYFPYNDKESKSKYFKIQLADMSNEIDEKLFEQIFGHTFVKLVDKLISTTSKEENQIIVKNIEKSKDKLLEMDRFHNFVIQAQQRSDLKYY